MKRYFRVSWRIAVIFILAWFIAATLLLELWPIVRTDGEWAAISNIQYGFTVDYPTKWHAEIYDEYGYRGIDAIKLHIYRSLLGKFVITARYQRRVTPTLEDVQEWRNILIIQANRALTKEGKAIFQELESNEGILNGRPIIRRKYSNGKFILEDVYISRANDMIIITLQAEADEFDEYVEDFEAILTSFRPVE